MNITINNNTHTGFFYTFIPMSKNELRLLSTLIYNECGISISDHSETMLKSRLQKRLNSLKIRSYSKYLELLNSAEGRNKELTNFINAVCTHETSFFRQINHFKYLETSILPKISKQLTERDSFNIWSAACSSGQEAYSIAATINDFKNIACKSNILASDISEKTLIRAKTGIFNQKEINNIPELKLKKLFLKGKNINTGLYKILPEIRDMILFKKINLMENSYRLHAKMDVIFCRNVMIYFNNEKKKHVINNLYDSLKKGGHLFVGSSESLHKIDNRFTAVAPEIYIK